MAERILKNWLAAYMEHTQHSEAPEKFHKWTAISTIAGALRRKVWIDMGYFQWSPNFFILLIAPAGIVNKSTTSNLGMSILRELPFINFGPSSGSWQAIIAKMASCQESFKLPNGDEMPMAAITIDASELGTLLDPRNREMVDVLVDLWDGKSGVWEKIAKTTDDDRIENPWINLIGCTTPSWVAENFTEYFTGGGLASRIVFIYGENKKQLVAYPQRRIPVTFKQERQALIHDLKIISSLAGEFEISEEAFEWGETWYKSHHASDHSHIASDKFSGYLARKQTHVHKLAMILSISESNELIITRDHLKKAVEEVTILEDEMALIFSQMNKDAEMALASDILIVIRKTGKIQKSILYREFMKIINYDTYERILRSLINSDLVKQEQIGTRMFLIIKERDEC